MREVFPHASERRVCRLLSVPRSAMSERRSATQKEPTTDHLLTERIEELIQKHPTFGYRRLWAVLRFRDGLLVNRKTPVPHPKGERLVLSRAPAYAAAPGPRTPEPG